ncbi:DUF7740 domain-containing protein [Pseudomonas sp. R151218B TE3479]
MNLTDATLVLLLAARIHGTDEAVRASAKSVLKKLPRSKRDLIYKVILSAAAILANLATLAQMALILGAVEPALWLVASCSV